MQDLYHRACARKAIAAYATGLVLTLWASATHGQQSVQPPPTVVGYDPGGSIREYDQHWRAVAAAGGLVVIRGSCRSACTLVVARVPRGRICFAGTAALQFHQARNDDGQPATDATRWMIGSYPEDIRGWIMGRGGAAAIPLHSYWTLTAQELWHMGYGKCAD